MLLKCRFNMAAKLMPLTLTLTAALILMLNLSTAHGDHETCSAYVYPGFDGVDIKLAVIIGIHGAKEGKCETNFLSPALQQVVAMNWAASMLNGDNTTGSFIPGIRIGVDVYDDCYTEYLAARHAGALASHARGISECLASDKSVTSDPPIAGVIGTSISQTTTIVANIVQPTNIPVVGISATLPELGDKSKYPGFMRTVPSDLKQAKVIIELAKHFSWSYIVGVQTSDNYGIQGMAEVKKMAEQERICVTFVEEFQLFTEIAESQMENFVRGKLFDKIDRSKGSIGVVYFGRNPALITLLEYIKSKKVLWLNADEYLKKIYWVASDAVVTSKPLAQLIDEYQTKIIVVGPPELQIPSFKNYFFGPFLENPPAWVTGQWRVAIGDIVRNEYGCTNYNFTKESLAGCNIQNRATDTSYMTASLDAVYLLANTIKAIHQDTCRGQPGMCTSFRSSLEKGLLRTYKVQDLDYRLIDATYVPSEFSLIQRYLKNVSGDFETVNQTQYSIQANRNGDFMQVGEFKHETVIIYPGYETIMKASQCKDTCDECLNIDHIHYLFSPGSVIIVGLFSIHWESDDEPFECGLYREQSVSYVAMLAFLNSIQQLNSQTGLDFGYLVIDDCYNVLTAGRMLNKILSGDLNIIDSNTGEKFDPSKTAVAIGAQSSPVTLASLPVLQNLGIPMISYSSTNPNLDNPISYPYFSRTVSSDAVQAQAITLILKELGVTYVGAIVIQNSYGLELYRLFRSMAEAEDICVDDAFEMTEKTTVQEVEPVLLKYRSRNMKVIVAFVMDRIASTILAATRQEDTFVFIASEAWGPNLDILNGQNGERARGALVLGASTAVQLDYGLKEYLKTIEPFNSESDGWLREFWQEQFKCDLPGGFNNIHHVLCVQRNEYFTDNELNNLVQSPLAVHSTMATISAGLAVQSLFRGNKKMPFDPLEITKAIRTVEMTSANQVKFRPFLDSGNGNGGFQIYNIHQVGSKYAYTDVGLFKSNGDLTMDRSKIKFYDVTGNVVTSVNSSCLFQSQCTVCADGIVSTSKPGGVTDSGVSGQGGSDDSSHSPAVIALSVICALLFLIVAAVVVLVILVYLGKISLGKDKRYAESNSVGYSAGSSCVTVSRIGGNNYSSPNSSKFTESDVRPPLPARKLSSLRPQLIYDNKAFSDIVTTDIDHNAPLDTETRARSLSLPLRHDAGIGPDDDSDLKTAFIETRPMPHPHMPMRNLAQTSPSSSASQHSEPVPLIRQTKPTQEVQPLQSPFQQTDSKDSNPNLHGMAYPQANQQGRNPEVAVLDPYNLYKDYYRNDASQSPQFHPGCPPGPIIFQNVSGNSMVYSTPSSVNANVASVPDSHNQSNPNFVYLQTPDGIVAVPYEIFLSWQNSQIDKASPNLGIDVNAQPLQGIVSNSNTGVLMTSSVPFPHHSYLNTPPGPCGLNAGQHDYITPINVIYVDGKQAQNNRVHGVFTESPPTQFTAQGIPVHNIQGGPAYAADSISGQTNFAHPHNGMASSTHSDITHTVDSSEYPTHHTNVHMVSHLASPKDNQLLNAHNLPHPSTVMPGQHAFPQASSAGIIMQQPNQTMQTQNIRPTNLPVVPVQLVNQQQPVHHVNFSPAVQYQGDSSAAFNSDSDGNFQSPSSPNLVIKHEAQINPPEVLLPPAHMEGHNKLGNQGQTFPESNDPPSDSGKLNFAKMPGPTRVAQAPQYSDILEESGSFQMNI